LDKAVEPYIYQVQRLLLLLFGLWQPSVDSNLAFVSFNVGSSYHCAEEFTNR